MLDGKMRDRCFPIQEIFFEGNENIVEIIDHEVYFTISIDNLQ